MKKLKHKSKRLLSIEINDMIHAIIQNLSKKELIDLWFFVEEMKDKKKRIYVGGRGNIDECDRCGKEYCSGVAGFDYKFNELNVCDDCLKKYYIVENE